MTVEARIDSPNPDHNTQELDKKWQAKHRAKIGEYFVTKYQQDWVGSGEEWLTVEFWGKSKIHFYVFSI